MPIYENDNELYHHGIQGQKWGIRRYQNEDGSLTALGAKRYGNMNSKDAQKFTKYTKKAMDRVNKKKNSLSFEIEVGDRQMKALNSGLIKKYNDNYDKKLGSEKIKNHDYMNDEEYTKGFYEMIDKVKEKTVKQLTNELYENDSYVKKAMKIISKYE